MSTRTLLRGGIVITAASTGESLEGADILIEDGKIAAIGHDLSAADAEVIDVTGRIVLPGFVDTHRHTWQSVVRNVASDWSLTEYLAGLHTGLSKYFRPKTPTPATTSAPYEPTTPSITTSSTGRTTSRPPAHARPRHPARSRTRGMRAVFAHGGGNKQWGAPLPSPNNHPDDARRIRDQYFSDNHRARHDGPRASRPLSSRSRR